MKLKMKTFFILTSLITSSLFSSSYEMHGVIIDDPYDYLEDMESKETLAWLDKQDQKSHEYFSKLTKREEIKELLVKNANYNLCGIPQEINGNFIYSFKDKSQDKKKLLFEDPKGNVTVIVDPNTIKSDENVSLVSFELSPNGNIVSYGLQYSGSDFQTWHFYDLKNKKTLKSTVSEIKFSSPKWSDDSKGVYYAKWQKKEFSAPDLCLGVFFHPIDHQNTSLDLTILDTKSTPNHLFSPNFEVSNGEYLLISKMDFSSSDLGALLVNLKDFSIKEIIPTKLAQFSAIEEREGALFFWTSYHAPNKKVIAIDLKNLTLDSAIDVIAESQNELTEVIALKDYLVCHYIDDCKSKISFFDLKKQKVKDLPSKRPSFIALIPPIQTSECYQNNTLYFAEMDFTTPYSIYSYSIENQNRGLFHKPIEKNTNFVTEQVFFKSLDGTEVPMFITRHKDSLPDGNQPTLMWGYGGFNIAILPFYFQHITTWLELGGTFVTVNLRGGSEYGTNWYDQGRLHNKQNVFDDFISAGEYLIKNGYTNSSKLAINGASNGGLLVGACLTQRPDLFGAAVAQVGVLDMLKFHKYTIGSAWISDYGNPEDPNDFKVLYAYSPYHNIKPATKYPPTLIMTADHDDRVVPLHSYKFAAKLQEAQASQNQILLRLQRKEGHGAGGGSLDKQLENHADVLSFLYEELKMN